MACLLCDLVKGKSSKEAINKPEKQVQKKKWTKEDDAAVKIQFAMRRFLAKRKLARKKKEKEEYDELMDKLERDASTLSQYILFGLVFL